MSNGRCTWSAGCLIAYTEASRGSRWFRDTGGPARLCQCRLCLPHPVAAAIQGAQSEPSDAISSAEDCREYRAQKHCPRGSGARPSHVVSRRTLRSVVHRPLTVSALVPVVHDIALRRHLLAAARPCDVQAHATTLALMWRRLTQALVVWISLVGLIPAALACAQVMVERDCCPPGQQMLCDESPGQASVESAACCATSNLAPASIQAVGEHVRDHLDVSLDTAPMAWMTLHPWPIPKLGAQGLCDFEPPDPSIDRSRLYLQTGRLRL